MKADPNVTADAAALCLRSANAVILRCGSEALQSSLEIARAFDEALSICGVPQEAVQIVPVADRDAVGAILSGLDGTIDLIIPRGGKSLVERVQKEARAPVLAHLEGLNHTYVHASADLSKALDIVVNAKMRRVGVCGATETLLVDQPIAAEFLEKLVPVLEGLGCELRGDEAACAVAAMTPANENDWEN